MVGKSMGRITDITGRALRLLGEAGIGIHAINQGTSQSHLAFAVEQDQVRDTLETLHEAFIDPQGILDDGGDWGATVSWPE